MNDNTNQYSRTHNIVLIFITVACFGAVYECISQRWEFWVPPLIIIGMFVCWFFHLTQYRQQASRENFYLFFSMIVSFYHGVHLSSFFDLVVISALLMVTVALLSRREYLILLLAEFFLLFGMQLFFMIRNGTLIFDALTISRIVLHIVVEICIYRALNEVIRSRKKDEEELKRREEEKENEKSEMEDFLVNVSHELRTPVNVIGGMSSVILKEEEREDVMAIRDAGLRLSRQIEDIQDYSEVQRGDVVLEKEKYMLTSVINDIVADYSMKVQRKELELVVDLDPDLPALLQGDAGKIGKILRHLLSNAVKFTPQGGIYIKLSGIRHEYGLNLILEITDTGVGMRSEELEHISEGSYQANKKRNRSTGGIGLGLPIVYGFTRTMGGFVTVESEKGKGLHASVSIPQTILDPSPCLSLEGDGYVNIAYFMLREKNTSSHVSEFYRRMLSNLASGLRVNLYSVGSVKEVERLLERSNISHLILRAQEYEQDPQFFDRLAEDGLTVALSAPEDYRITPGSAVLLMPKPLCTYPIVRILNGDRKHLLPVEQEEEKRPVLDGVRALVVDDEPMNLVVAGGLFRGYNMIIDTAESGLEAIEKYSLNDYDLVFMDHMMPGMDGVEAMKRIREVATQQERTVKLIALTANAISGAKEMFLKEGFDGFIAKPINIADFERTINKVLPSARRGGAA